MRRWCPCPMLLALLLTCLMGPAVSAETRSGYLLNLQQADLRSLINTVSQRTGRNFVVDPRVDARVTVVSTMPLGATELYEVFETVLEVHGYAAIEQGEITRIVPSATARQHAVPLAEHGARHGGIVTRVLVIEHVSASQLVPVLRPLLPQVAHLAAYEPTNRLIVTDSARNIDRIEHIVARVDRPTDRSIDVIRLENARAAQVIGVLAEIAPADTDASARLSADPRTNSLLVRGDEATRLEVRALVANLDTPIEEAGNTRVLYLRHARAEDLVSILEGVGRGQRARDDAPTNGEAVIQADPATNALVLTGSADELAGLESVVHQLDIRRSQVLVEAIIAELSTDRARDLGIQLALDASNGDGVAALTRFADGGSDLVNILASPEQVDRGLTLGALTESGGNDFGLLLRALASDADNNILSTPSLVTLDNQEAEIVVGQNVPFVTGQFTGQAVGDTAGRSPFQTIERQDVGLTLKVKPQINEGDTVQLAIEQEVSSLADRAQAADIVTNTRSLNTTVLVDDGQTLVLGGLIDDTLRTREERVPLIGDIPVLGQLFRYERTNTVKRNLMVFLQPRILRDGATADRHTREKYNEMRAAQLAQGEKAPRFGAGDVPVLPALELEYRDAAEGP